MTALKAFAGLVGVLVTGCAFGGFEAGGSSESLRPPVAALPPPECQSTLPLCSEHPANCTDTPCCQNGCLGPVTCTSCAPQRDEHCDDGSMLMCRMLEPECPDGQIAAIRQGCWECVDALTCGADRLFAAVDETI